MSFGRTEHYQVSGIVTFGKFSGKYETRSNTSTVYPVELFRLRCYISEHLFIALRFSEHSDLQREIIEYKNSLWCKKSCINGKKSGILPPSQQSWQLFWCGCDEVHRQPQKPTERRFRKLLTLPRVKLSSKRPRCTMHRMSSWYWDERDGISKKGAYQTGP